MKLMAVVAGAAAQALVGALLLPVVIVVAAAAILPGAAPNPSPAASGPPAALTADIPAPMRALYVASAARCPGLSWTVIAAIGKLETDHGRGRERSAAGAEGPMQFLPATWARYAVDGDGDGVASIWDPADAVPAAADYLCTNGAGTQTGLEAAIYQYNHDANYVRTVLTIAAAYARAAVTG